MAGEISLNREMDEILEDEEYGLLRTLEERVTALLMKCQELMQERDGFTAALDSEREKVRELEKRLVLLTQDRENVKTRIDQLLHRLKGIDL